MQDRKPWVNDKQEKLKIVYTQVEAVRGALRALMMPCFLIWGPVAGVVPLIKIHCDQDVCCFLYVYYTSIKRF